MLYLPPARSMLKYVELLQADPIIESTRSISCRCLRCQASSWLLICFFLRLTITIEEDLSDTSFEDEWTKLQRENKVQMTAEDFWILCVTLSALATGLLVFSWNSIKDHDMFTSSWC